MASKLMTRRLPGDAMANDLKNPAITAGRVTENQADVASIRKQPLFPALVKVLSHADVEVDVVIADSRRRRRTTHSVLCALTRIELLGSLKVS